MSSRCQQKTIFTLVSQYLGDLNEYLIAVSWLLIMSIRNFMQLFRINWMSSRCEHKTSFGFSLLISVLNCIVFFACVNEFKPDNEYYFKPFKYPVIDLSMIVFIITLVNSFHHANIYYDCFVYFNRNGSNDVDEIT